VVRDFLERRVSGQVTLTLNFQVGEVRPSALGIHELGVGERRPQDP
jgi:hypothetical protein